jgi:hypothetical protein
MASTAQLKQYCVDHGYSLSTQVSTQGHHMPSFLTWTLVGYIVAGLIGYEICKYGIKTIYTTLRTDFSAQKATPIVSATKVTTVSTSVATAAPATVITSST